jgi:N6-adenosine-specific RNA methylase IME4
VGVGVDGAVSEFAPLPDGPFDVIVADPPWMYQKQPGINGPGAGSPGIAETVYPTLTNEQIARLPVADIAAKDAHLFLWFTNPFTWGGRRSGLHPELIANAWGFEFKTVLTWVKTTRAGGINQGGLGWYFRGCTEHVLYATRGKAGIPVGLREPNVLLAPKSRHSAKPPEFMAMVERVIPDGRRLELFCRTSRPGWTAWGNEIAPLGEVDLFGGAA